MVTKKQAYQPPNDYLFLDQKRKMGLVKRIKKQINKFDIKPEDLDFSISWFSITKFDVSRDYENEHPKILVNAFDFDIL